MKTAHMQAALGNQRRPDTRTIACLVLLAVLTAVVRVAYLSHERLFESTSTAEMERAALSLAQQGVIGNVYSASSGPTAHVAPLYPILLATLYTLAGPGTMKSRMLQEAAAIGITFLGIALLPGVARALQLNSTTGWMAAFTMAVLPVNLWLESSGAWEQPLAAVVLLALLMVTCRIQHERGSRMFSFGQAGALIGCAALLCPSVLPAALLMSSALFLVPDTRVRLRLLQGLVVAVSLAATMVAPWAVRNRLVLGGWVPFRSNFGLELAIGHNDFATGATHYPHTPPHHPFISAAHRERIEQIGELAYMKEQQAAALDWIRMHPGRTVWLTARRVWLYWFPPPSLWPSESAGNTVKAAVFWAASAGALCGLTMLVFSGAPTAGIAAAATIGPSLVYLVTHVDPRYRYPVFGLTVLLSCEVIARSARWFGQARSR